jgi:hypothetical protein
VEEFRICSKCHIEKPLTTEFFGPQQKNKARLHTECRACKLEYSRRYSEKKKLSRDPEQRRLREIYEIKEITKEEQQEKLKKAYAHIYYEAFGAAITTERLKSIEGIEE